ncbi:MAG: ATP-dependent DNA helicase UvrD2, partial [Actinomycetota bacterium]|nr:ATP-dependent DNA helicase UvrD2 [Actinomycetota bacterium]
MQRDAIFADLNPEQRRAVEAVRGPVCILAGAGSGKTTTITRRIANQVATGAFLPDEILAVTFTDKAAGEMRHRLGALDVDGVHARTFHATALGQLHAYGRTPPGAVLPSKVILLTHVARTLPRAYRFRPLGDLATEIEWAKNRRLTPDTYARLLGDHRPPIPSDLMTRVFRDYERRKQALGRIDFEDVLELAVRMFDEDEQARVLFRERFRAFTVDEFQDVNLLQYTLLGHWLGGSDELCVVGDDYQSIYSFVGATPRYLLDLPERFPHAAVIRLESNYRSTPQILELANRLTPRLGGAEKVLRPARPDGPDPVVRTCDGPEETRFVVEQARALHDEQGIPYYEMAVLYRMNLRSEPYEQAFAAAWIPVQIREGAFLTRQAARRIRKQLGASVSTAVGASVRAAADREGYLESLTEKLGDQETVRQADLARLIELAEDFDDGTRTVADFFSDLEGRFGPNAVGRGVHLLTYHRAKGLEFDVVFLPRLEEKELPIRLARTPEELAEERRLFYVGMTRARRHLYLSRAERAKPSRFLLELGVAEPGRTPRLVDEAARGSPAYAALAAWRRKRAERDGVAAFLVFHNTTLEEIVRRAP